MACPGSAKLAEAIKLNYPGIGGDDPEWTRQGTQAHALAAECLETGSEAWMLVTPDKYPDVDAAILRAVQVYVDYVNSIPGRKKYEVRYHLPQLHPQMYGTIDTEAYSPSQEAPVRLEIVDYKNGAGVFVAVEQNVQLMYYAAMVIYSDEGAFIGSDHVKLTIVQPNAPGEPIRSWLTTVQEIRDWVNVSLLPAMSLAQVGDYLELGKHCQFCPAKLVCPAMRQLLLKANSRTPNDTFMYGLTNEDLGQLFTELRPLAFYKKAIETEVFRRLMDRQPVFNAKLIEGRANRRWKEGFEAALRERFGDAGFTKPEPLSPAKVEDLPDGGKFVAEYAYKPEAGLNVAYADDPKAAVVPKLASELHTISQKLLDNMV